MSPQQAESTLCYKVTACESYHEFGITFVIPKIMLYRILLEAPFLQGIFQKIRYNILPPDRRDRRNFSTIKRSFGITFGVYNPYRRRSRSSSVTVYLLFSTSEFTSTPSAIARSMAFLLSSVSACA